MPRHQVMRKGKASLNREQGADVCLFHEHLLPLLSTSTLLVTGHGMALQLVAIGHVTLLPADLPSQIGA